MRGFTMTEWIEVLKIEKITAKTKKTTIFSVNKETNLVEFVKAFLENRKEGIFP
jgi:hypothetical protein